MGSDEERAAAVAVLLLLCTCVLVVFSSLLFWRDLAIGGLVVTFSAVVVSSVILTGTFCVTSIAACVVCNRKRNGDDDDGEERSCNPSGATKVSVGAVFLFSACIVWIFFVIAAASFWQNPYVKGVGAFAVLPAFMLLPTLGVVVRADCTRPKEKRMYSVLTPSSSQLPSYKPPPLSEQQRFAVLFVPLD